MQTDVLFCGLKELGHLRLRQPNRFFLHPNFQTYAAVGLVEDDLAAGCGDWPVLYDCVLLFHL